MKAYISFEGPFGSGKTTQLLRVSKELKKRGEKVFIKQGGTGTNKGRLVEESILYDQYRKFIGRHFSLKLDITKCLRRDPNRFYFSVKLPMVESFLVLARHAVDWETAVIPLLDYPDMIFMADRDLDTFYCHQLITFTKALPHINKQMILEQMRRIALTWFNEPNLTIYLRMSAKDALERLNTKGEAISHPLDREILEESIKMYDFLAKYFHKRFVIVDGSQERGKITSKIIDVITEYLDKCYK